MPTTTGFSFGDVVLVPFPFTDQTTSKKRPAVVVSSAAYNRDRHDVVVVAVTGQMSKHSSAVGEARIGAWREAGLLKESRIKPVFTTIEQTLVLRKLGALQDRDVATLRRVLREVLA